MNNRSSRLISLTASKDESIFIQLMTMSILFKSKLSINADALFAGMSRWITGVIKGTSNDALRKETDKK